LEKEWDELARGASPFVQPGWIAAWWRAFGEGELLILTARRGGRLVGVLPLAQRRGVLHSPTNWHTPVFGAVALDPEASSALAHGVLERSAHRVQLRFLPSDAPLAQDIHAAADDAGYRVEERVLLRSPYVQVTGNWDADWEKYWSHRSRNLRKGVKRLSNRLADLGAVSVEIRTGADGLAEALEDAFAVEASGWKGEQGTAIVSQPDTRRFYEEIADWAAERDILRIAILRIDGRAAAMHLSIEAGGDYYMLKTGYEAELEKAGPGKILDRMMVERAFTTGLDSLEFLGGDDEYKMIWTDQCHDRIELQAFKRSPRGLLDRSVQIHGRSLARRAAALARR
jgi:CelD/BcsL family acetyltransferase involved in cellulose biosynthesis